MEPACPFQLSMIAYGVPFAVHTNRKSALREVTRYLPVGSKTAPQRLPPNRLPPLVYRILFSEDNIALYDQGRRVFVASDELSVFEALENRCTIAVADGSVKHLFVHAGVVGWRGRAILLPGRSFAGKSTLVAELIKRGATYYSDEFALLDGKGRVHPYSRSLRLRRPGLTRQQHHSPESLGASVGRTPLPIGVVLFSRYRKGADTKWRGISTGLAVLEAMRHTISVRREPEFALDTLTTALTPALALKGRRGEASAAAQCLIEWMAHSSPKP